MALTRRDIREGMLILVRTRTGHTYTAAVERVTLPFLLVRAHSVAWHSLRTYRVDLDHVRIWAVKSADLTPQERDAFAAEATT
jgi:hypothetical protein